MKRTHLLISLGLIVGVSTVVGGALLTGEPQELQTREVREEPVAPSAQWLEGGGIGEGHGSVVHNITIDSEGRAHLVYTGPDSSTTSIYYAVSEDGQEWMEPKVLYKGPRGLGANIAVGKEDTLHVIFNQREQRGEAIMHLFSNDGGTNWSSPTQITPVYEEELSTANLSIDPSGRLHVAWHVGTLDDAESSAHVYYTQSKDNGETFESPQKLDSGTDKAGWPRFTTLHNEVIAVAWRDNRRNPDWDVYVAISDDGGATFTQHVVGATSQKEWDPDVLVDTNGVIHLAYMVYETSGISIDYVQSTNLGMNWTDPVTLSTHRSRFPFFVGHVNSETIGLFWKDERDFVAPNGRNVERNDAPLGYKADIAGIVSINNGKTWGDVERVTDLGDTEVKFPAFAMSSEGTIFAVWNDDRNGSETMYFSRRY